MKQLERTLKLRLSECDVNGLWRPGAMLVEMQEAAGDQCTGMNCGRETLVKSGLVWVVVRLELRIRRYPSFGENVTIRTWHRPARHRFFPRFFEIRDSAGETIVQASSIWVLMDLETRQSVDQDRLSQPLPDNSDMPEAIPLPRGIASVDGPEKVTSLLAGYTDLDANGHVNNTKYIDWLCNALGTECMTEHPIRQLTIHFDSEVRPEQPVEMHLKQEGLAYQMTGLHDGKVAFEISGTLMESRP